MSSLDQDIQFTLVKDFIFLTETHIAGLRYTPDLDDILTDIYVKMSLRAYLEVDNEYDEDAVVIVDNKNRKIGHIPRPKNQIIANLIRAGKDIECTVEQIGTFRGEPDVRISIYMEENRTVKRGLEDRCPDISGDTRKRQTFNNKRYQYN